MVQFTKTDKLNAIFRAHDVIEDCLTALLLDGMAYTKDKGFFPVNVLPSQLPPALRQLYAILEVANANCVRYLKNN